MPDNNSREAQQTHEEWWEDYDSCFQNNVSNPTITSTNVKNIVQAEVQRKFRFIGFRTTYQSRLVISFIDIKTGEIADCFFNVGIKKLRGSGNHETGNRGQFFPPEFGTFRKFWMQAVKREPIRWSTVHKAMRPRLKNLLFTGKTKIAYDKNNKPYIQLINPVCIGTYKEQ